LTLEFTRNKKKEQNVFTIFTIDYLSKCLKKPEMVQKHHKRVNNIKIGCALMLIGMLGTNIILSSEFVRTNALSWKLESSYENWKFEDRYLLTKMGDLLYFQDQKNKAEKCIVEH
jgi:hypothetical protein